MKSKSGGERTIRRFILLGGVGCLNRQHEYRYLLWLNEYTDSVKGGHLGVIERSPVLCAGQPAHQDDDTIDDSLLT